VEIHKGECDDGQFPSDAEHVGDEEEDKDHHLELWII
jgi:hypothetical protein